jgi:hypothetical protein
MIETLSRICVDLVILLIPHSDLMATSQSGAGFVIFCKVLLPKTLARRVYRWSANNGSVKDNIRLTRRISNVKTDQVERGERERQTRERNGRPGKPGSEVFLCFKTLFHNRGTQNATWGFPLDARVMREQLLDFESGVGQNPKTNAVPE